MMRIYISGPMTGIKDFNRAAFRKAERDLRKRFAEEPDLDIVSPVAIQKLVDDLYGCGRQGEKPKWADYMRLCIAILPGCTHICHLDGWEKSRGATLEWQVAEELGIEDVRGVLTAKEREAWGRHAARLEKEAAEERRKQAAETRKRWTTCSA
jgi:hypothetical protein